VIPSNFERAVVCLPRTWLRYLFVFLRHTLSRFLAFQPVRHTPRNALAAAGLACAGLAVTGLLAFLAPFAHSVDIAALRRFVELDRPQLTPALTTVGLVGTTLVYALLGTLLVAWALRQGRPRLAGVVAMILFFSEATAELLKSLFAGLRGPALIGDHMTVGLASWPSGHTTAAATVAVCSILVTPARHRQTVVFTGAALTIAAGYGTLVTGAHLLTDVVAALFVSALWTSLGLAVLWQGQDSDVHATRWRWDAGNVYRSVLASSGLALVVAVAAVISWGDALTHYVSDHPVFLTLMLVLALSAQMLVTGAATSMKSSAVMRRGLRLGPGPPG
jgi:membrane-associated phospholipid phosphatase